MFLYTSRKVTCFDPIPLFSQVTSELKFFILGEAVSLDHRNKSSIDIMYIYKKLETFIGWTEKHGSSCCDIYINLGM